MSAPFADRQTGIYDEFWETGESRYILQKNEGTDGTVIVRPVLSRCSLKQEHLHGRSYKSGSHYRDSMPSHIYPVSGFCH